MASFAPYSVQFRVNGTGWHGATVTQKPSIYRNVEIAHTGSSRELYIERRIYALFLCRFSYLWRATSRLSLRGGRRKPRHLVALLTRGSQHDGSHNGDASSAGALVAWTLEKSEDAFRF